MKKKLLLLLSSVCVFSFMSQAQKTGRYTVYGGVLGGGNYSHYFFCDKQSDFDNAYRFGWNAGLYFGVPVTKTFSIEPQVMFNRVGGQFLYKDKLANPANDDLRADYISVPVLFKFNIGRNFDVFAGPQFDFLMKAREVNSGADVKEYMKSTDIAATGGFEVFPRNRVTFYGRYYRGFQNVADGGTPTFYNEGFQAGLKFKLFGKQVKAAPIVVPVPSKPTAVDSDGDGVPDSKDKCPDMAGLAKYNGCPIPDSDNDGVNDEEDKCPNIPGVAKYQGCPVPDSDNDGVNDEEDKCPNISGVARYHGCPIPDTDNDGINDEQDKCPTVAGTRENHGCPEIKKETIAKVQKAANAIFFQTGKAAILPKSNAQLNEIVKVLNTDPSLYLDIKGHTDNVGKAEANQKLSQQRADAVKAYMVKKGISEDRITSAGYGDSMPIAPNTTAVGRQKNRRVEMVLQNYK
ncbi:OmpA family protein [Pinibacter aurantiacus]|uniref:OmpA family protein n=1 Tax=Pinibacter aurantiacus TaxID=2851599 RepID=A0A9E2W7D3_9BACT|nr:OmpA family protein [Pinibacter aurantiacus]MBV4356461.1 OmpA family protein [Pinibacter aurantiacus]